MFLNGVFDFFVTEEAAASLLEESPELGWLALCIKRCPLPPCWTSENGQFVDTDSGKGTDVPPMLGHFVHLGRLMLQWRQKEMAACEVAAALEKSQHQFEEEASRARKVWTLHTDGPSQFWHCALTGRSTWGDPTAALGFLARVAERLLQALPDARQEALREVMADIAASGRREGARSLTPPPENGPPRQRYRRRFTERLGPLSQDRDTTPPPPAPEARQERCATPVPPAPSVVPTLPEGKAPAGRPKSRKGSWHSGQHLAAVEARESVLETVGARQTGGGLEAEPTTPTTWRLVRESILEIDAPATPSTRRGRDPEVCVESCQSPPATRSIWSRVRGARAQMEDPISPSIMSVRSPGPDSPSILLVEEAKTPTPRKRISRHRAALCGA